MTKEIWFADAFKQDALAQVVERRHWVSHVAERLREQCRTFGLITVRIGCKCRPGLYGGKPAVVTYNTLDRQQIVHIQKTVTRALS